MTNPSAGVSFWKLPCIPRLPSKNNQVLHPQGQEKPELLGWRIYDTTATLWPVPTYEWQADGSFSRAWVIQMQANESEWPVESVEPHPTEQPGEIRFTIHRRDGGSDHVLRRFPGQPPVEFQGESIAGDLAVLGSDASGAERNRLEMKAGNESVAHAHSGHGGTQFFVPRRNPNYRQPEKRK